MRKDAPLAVDVPSSTKDSPGWIKVGVIAAVGFTIGVAWPRIAGVKIGPSAPGEAASAAAASAGAKRAPDAPPATVATEAPSNAASAPASVAVPRVTASAPAAVAATAGPPRITVARGSVLSCKTDSGETKRGKECGNIGALDGLVAPRLRRLSTCTAAEGQTGKLSFVVNADFGGGHLAWDIGKSSTVGNQDALGACLKSIFQGVNVGTVGHEHPRYTVAYTATFSPGSPEAKSDVKEDHASANAKASTDDKPDAKPEPKEALPPGEATVGWEIALVRDTPKTGQIVARLPRGTRVKVGSSKEGWFAVKYGDGFASDGWLYRGAIGR